MSDAPDDDAGAGARAATLILFDEFEPCVADRTADAVWVLFQAATQQSKDRPAHRRAGWTTSDLLSGHRQGQRDVVAFEGSLPVSIS